MGLPTKAIDRIFERLTLAYGVRFAAQYEGMPTADVKTDWCQWLSGFAGRLDAIAWALDNLPDQPVNAMQFRSLCRQAPAPVTVALPTPPADPQRMREELAKLAPVLAEGRASAVDSKGWARQLLARADAGERLNLTVVRMARQALGVQASGVGA